MPRSAQGPYLFPAGARLGSDNVVLQARARDMDHSVKFYRETLGLPMLGQPDVVTQFQAGDVIIALNGPLGPAAGDAMIGAVEIVFPVQSVAKVRTDLARRGCIFLNEPREIFPGTWGATFTVPDGHRLTILGPQ
jgi:catechol 2,3-dioxygenase-like lactoylglutathione lyase family enzyme